MNERTVENIPQVTVHTDVSGIVGVESIFIIDVITETPNHDFVEITHIPDHIQKNNS